jgi:hypothetical protein
MKRILLLVLTILVAITSLTAQRNKDKNEDANLRSVEGVVTEDGRIPVPRASVQLTDAKTLQIRSFVTQTDGTYHFSGLKMDTDYELKATLGERTSAKKRVSPFDSRKTVIVNLELGK